VSRRHDLGLTLVEDDMSSVLCVTSRGLI
jgi:hypothetical protein